jgi:serine/threonine protein phosphatase PrpC
MGEELDVPIKEYSPKDDQNTYLKYGLNKVQGWKKAMEDYTIDFAETNPEKFVNVFGIFDGHGGREVPKYLSAHFLEFLQKNTNFQNGKFKEALNETFFELDKSFTTKEAKEELKKYSEELKPSKEQEIKEINNLCGQGEKLNDEELEQIMAFNEVFDPRNIEDANIADFSGATGIILFIGDKNIYIANAGNSRCLVINQKGEVIKQTKDHTMKDEEEKKRVDLARSFNEEEEKKKGEEQQKVEYLDSTRGFGDWEFKGNEWIEQKDQEVSVEPEILEVPAKDVKYLIMGSHGMFENDINDNENDTNKKISEFFCEKMKGDQPYSKIIEEFFEKIISKDKNGNKGLDNMSCVLINLNEDTIGKYIEKKEKELEEKKKKEEEEKKRKKEEEQRKKEEMRKKAEEERKKKEEEKKKAEEQAKEAENKDAAKEGDENKNEIKEEAKDENKNVINEEKKADAKEADDKGEKKE